LLTRVGILLARVMGAAPRHGRSAARVLRPFQRLLASLAILALPVQDVSTLMHEFTLCLLPAAYLRF